MLSASAADRQQSLLDLEDLYVWLQQFEDPSIPTDEGKYSHEKVKKIFFYKNIFFLIFF